MISVAINDGNEFLNSFKNNLPERTGIEDRTSRHSCFSPRPWCVCVWVCVRVCVYVHPPRRLHLSGVGIPGNRSTMLC